MGVRLFIPQPTKFTANTTLEVYLIPWNFYYTASLLSSAYFVLF